MDIRELIQRGTDKAGTQTALATLLGVRTQHLSNIKAGQHGLPDYACFSLAELLNINPAIVIAASALVTEKNEERRKVFYPFVMGKAASLAALVFSFVILEMTSTPAQAAPSLKPAVTDLALCQLTAAPPARPRRGACHQSNTGMQTDFVSVYWSIAARPCSRP